MYVIQTVYCPHHMRILTVMHVVQSNPALRTLAEHGQFALSLGKNTDTFPGPLSLRGLTAFVQFRRKIIVSNEMPLSHLSEDMHSCRPATGLKKTRFVSTIDCVPTHLSKVTPPPPVIEVVK